MSNTIPTSVSVSDFECRAKAHDYVVQLFGSRPEALTWDTTHRLQGHVHVGDRDLVVIANRDPSSQPIVLTAHSWDAVRRCSADRRRHLIASCAITDHESLVSAMQSDEFALYAPALRLAA